MSTPRFVLAWSSKVAVDFAQNMRPEKVHVARRPTDLHGAREPIVYVIPHGHHAGSIKDMEHWNAIMRSRQARVIEVTDPYNFARGFTHAMEVSKL